MESTIRGLDNVHAASVRHRALLLLEQLMRERETLETALNERGWPDQYKAVTGSSSLDSAIASTRRMIADLDAAVSMPLPHLIKDRSRAPALATRVTARPVSVGV